MSGGELGTISKYKKIYAKPIILRKIKVSPKLSLLPIREDVICDSTTSNFIKGDSHRTVILNQLNLLNNHSRTVAKYYDVSQQVIKEITSDAVTKVIGEKNYSVIFNTLLSVIDQEQKIKSLLALLTSEKKVVHVGCQTESTETKAPEIICNSKTCESIGNVESLNVVEYPKRKRVKRQNNIPYIIKDEKNTAPDDIYKRVVIDPDLSKHNTKIEPASSNNKINEFNEMKLSIAKKGETLPLLKINNDDDVQSVSNISLSGFSVPDTIIEKFIKSDPKIPCQTNAEETGCNPCSITFSDGSTISVPFQPKDIFHLATPDILKHITKNEQNKLLIYQFLIDTKYCLHKGEDGNLPIQRAVFDNDLGLLKRQCVVLRRTPRTVDAVTDENEFTALQISVKQNSKAECTQLLLDYGADPLHRDEEDRTVLHLAAEGDATHLRVLLNYWRKDPRRILKENEELWRQEYDNRSDEQLALYLLRHVCQLHDSQGFTPLMLAAKIGKYENVKLLLEASPTSAKTQTPNSGDTALYLTVDAACCDAEKRHNKSQVSDDFKNTIELLLENDADPNITNYSGANVNTVLQEYNIRDLPIVIANKLIAVQYFGGTLPSNIKDCKSLMLLKDDDGNVKIEDTQRKSSISEFTPDPFCVQIKEEKMEDDNIETVTTYTLESSSDYVVQKLPTLKPLILENTKLKSSHFMIRPKNDLRKVTNVSSMRTSKIVGKDPRKIILTRDMKTSNKGKQTNHTTTSAKDTVLRKDTLKVKSCSSAAKQRNS